MGNIDDQHRNTNMNDKDHLVGQLTTSALDRPQISLPVHVNDAAETLMPWMG